MAADDAAAAVAVATDWREAPAEHEALIAAERKEAEASPQSGARTELVQKRIMGLMAAEGADRESLAAAIDWAPSSRPSRSWTTRSTTGSPFVRSPLPCLLLELRR